MTASSSDTSSTPHFNADQAELDKFAALAARWWDPESEFKPLHANNPLRLGWIRTHVGELNEKHILDVGCGGGIPAESVAQVGARVTGIVWAQKRLTASQQPAQETSM